ncbi:hypothetical protein [Williamsia sterculiae]|uniref:Uncharacterized protein n=1 Tax=Williamsia sterculiae TaxID=1344003 RepID=A0A1N7GH28_9NOCA|nr:hypothetical protein [Williamsia sterculiae]SIS11893.1 hypothetical protein SAMN05445060_2778 [Williamsia sterculiae]
MSNKTLSPTAPNQPRTIAVSVIIPWLIVTVMTAAVAGLIAGWFFHANVTVTNAEVLTAAASKADRR